MRRLLGVRRIGLTLSLVALLTSTILTSAGCAKAPPNLTPQAVTRFHHTQVVRYLDAVRDAANDAHHTNPPLLDAQWTLKVVNWHTAAVKIVKAAGAGWKEALYAGMGELLKDAPADAQNLLMPYLTSAKLVIQAVTQ